MLVLLAKRSISAVYNALPSHHVVPVGSWDLTPTIRRIGKPACDDGDLKQGKFKRALNIPALYPSECLYRSKATVRQPLLVYPQLRTWRRTAATDAMCHDRK
jgi:hypothetical protein